MTFIVDNVRATDTNVDPTLFMKVSDTSTANKLTVWTSQKINSLFNKTTTVSQPTNKILTGGSVEQYTGTCQRGSSTATLVGYTSYANSLLSTNKQSIIIPKIGTYMIMLVELVTGNQYQVYYYVVKKAGTLRSSNLVGFTTNTKTQQQRMTIVLNLNAGEEIEISFNDMNLNSCAHGPNVIWILREL
jgi:hypothetical protein